MRPLDRSRGTSCGTQTRNLHIALRSRLGAVTAVFCDEKEERYRPAIAVVSVRDVWKNILAYSSPSCDRDSAVRAACMSQKLEGAPSKMRLERANPGPNVAYPVDNQLNACADNNHSLSHVGSFLDCLTLILVGGKVNRRGRLMMWHTNANKRSVLFARNQDARR